MLWANKRNKSQLWVRMEFQLNVCQKCTTWKPLLSAAVSPEYHNGGQELNRISFTQRQLSPPQTAWVTLPKVIKRAGLAHMGFYQKRHEASWELSPLHRTKKHNNKTSGMSVLTVSHGRGNVISRNISEMKFDDELVSAMSILNSFWMPIYLITWHRCHLFVFMSSYDFPSTGI